MAIGISEDAGIADAVQRVRDTGDIKTVKHSAGKIIEQNIKIEQNLNKQTKMITLVAKGYILDDLASKVIEQDATMKDSLVKDVLIELIDNIPISEKTNVMNMIKCSGSLTSKWIQDNQLYKVSVVDSLAKVYENAVKSTGLIDPFPLLESNIK